MSVDTRIVTGQNRAGAEASGRLITRGVSSRGVKWRHTNPSADRSLPPTRPVQETVAPAMQALQTLLTPQTTPSVIERSVAQIAEDVRTATPDGNIAAQKEIFAQIPSLPGDRFRKAELISRLSHSLAEDTAEDGAPARVTLGARALAKTLQPGDFNKVGQIIYETVAEGATKQGQTIQQKVIERAQIALPDASSAVITGMIDTYAAVGSISRTPKGDIKLTRSPQPDGLTYAKIQAAVSAADNLRGPVSSSSQRPQTWDQVVQTHDEGSSRLNVSTVELQTPGTSAKILYLSELNIGYSAADPRFMSRVLDTVGRMPEGKKPDAIVMSGIVFGAHKYREKALQEVTVLDVDKQLAAAKLLLNQLSATGAVTVYSMSSNDRELARDIALDAVNALRKNSKSLVNHEKSGVPYYDQDALERSPDFQYHKWIATNVMFEYMLRSGRQLRTKEEVVRDTKGREQRDEYTLVLEAYNTLLQGRPLPQELRRTINIDAIPVPGKVRTDFFVEDNVNLTLSNGRKQLADGPIMVRQQLKLGSTPLYQNPNDSARAAVKQMLAAGQRVGALVTMHNMISLGSGTADGAWVMSVPGLLKDGSGALDMKGSAYATRGPQMRQVAGRRSLSVPGAEMHEMSADGRHTVWLMNDRLLDKMHTSRDRVAIVQLIDWQTGSVTMRPDLQVKFLDMMKGLLKKGKVYIYLGGDIIQGRNYPNMPNENAHIGLIRSDKQMEFVSRFMDNALRDVPVEDRRNVVGVSIVPGNHEWNSDFKNTGNVMVKYLSDYMKSWLGPAFDRQRIAQMVKTHEAMRTHDGSFADVWAGKVAIAGYNVLLQHLILEKGGKGNMSGEPVVQAQALFEGQSGLAQDVDIMLTGHWHHPQYGTFNGKVAAISGSLAGLSGYEWTRAHRPVVGALITHVGGGLPPALEFISQEALDAHKITEGYYSDAALGSTQRPPSRRFRSDSGFNPASNGFLPRAGAHSALQKELWAEIDSVTSHEEPFTGGLPNKPQ